MNDRCHLNKWKEVVYVDCKLISEKPNPIQDQLCIELKVEESRSFMFNRNKVVVKIEPCAASTWTEQQNDQQPFTTTVICLAMEYLEIQVHSLEKYLNRAVNENRHTTFYKRFLKYQSVTTCDPQSNSRNFFQLWVTKSKKIRTIFHVQVDWSLNVIRYSS